MFFKNSKKFVYFDEKIPLEITLNCTELNLKIKGVIISIIRKAKLYNLENPEILLSGSSIITSKQHLFDKKQECI